MPSKSQGHWGHPLGNDIHSILGRSIGIATCAMEDRISQPLLRIALMSLAAQCVITRNARPARRYEYSVRCGPVEWLWNFDVPKNVVSLVVAPRELDADHS